MLRNLEPFADLRPLLGCRIKRGFPGPLQRDAQQADHRVKVSSHGLTLAEKIKCRPCPEDDDPTANCSDIHELFLHQKRNDLSTTAAQHRTGPEEASPQAVATGSGLQHCRAGRAMVHGHERISMKSSAALRTLKGRGKNQRASRRT